jgi:hypothetical protein
MSNSRKSMAMFAIKHEILPLKSRFLPVKVRQRSQAAVGGAKLAAIIS